MQRYNEGSCVLEHMTGNIMESKCIMQAKRIIEGKRIMETLVV